MNEVVTFRTPDNRFDLTVKKEFIEKYPNDYDKHPALKLLSEFKIINYFHNPNGPAVVRYNKNGEPMQEEYFLNGTICSPEEAERIKHNKGFNDKFFDDKE